MSPSVEYLSRSFPQPHGIDRARIGAATVDYINTVLTHRPDEAAVLPGLDDPTH
ncbi:MAG: hypothetical protein WAO41_00410 [Candidatus Nanopelagicales bacterium]